MDDESPVQNTIGFLVLFLLCYWAYKVFVWMKTGDWPHYSIGSVLNVAPPHINWVGIQKLADWYFSTDLTLSVPIGVVSLIVLITIALLPFIFLNEYLREYRHKK